MTSLGLNEIITSELENRMAENETAALAIGKKLVALCQEGRDLDAVNTLYDEKIVSIEASGSDDMPARQEGIETILGKHAWWTDNNDVHSSTAEGPFCGDREDQFAVRFEMDLTPKATGERVQFAEIALYTTAKGKIVQEEFMAQAS